jgi:hypothetical protein
MLGAPDIVGTLSECSLGVQFHKLVPGATVRLQTTAGGMIDEWPVSSADQAFEFHPGRKVKAGMNVQAVQFRPGEAGLLSGAVHVDAPPSPAALSKGAFAKPLYECGECVWLFGFFPGATVRIFSHGNEFLGESVVRPDGQAHVDLKRALTARDDLSAVQTACASLGGPVTSASPILGGHPVPLDGLALPQTQVATVKACATALYFEKVMAGAFVILTRTPKGGSPTTYGPSCLSVSTFTIWGYAPFQGDEQLVIETQLEKCGRKVGSAVKLTVDSSLPDPPKFLKDICSDATEILLGGLELNATVEITVTTSGSTVTLVFGASAPQDAFKLSPGQPGAPKLGPGSTVTVRQNLCGGPASWSKPNSTKVLAAAAAVPKPSAPADHSTVSGLTPTLSWIDTGHAPCSQATKYDLRVATTVVMAPGDIVFAPSIGLVGTSVSIPGGVLKAATTYFWQVRAYHGNTPPSAWSSVFQFSTQQAPVGSPPPGGGTGDQTFFFCQVCPGFDQGKTISVTAPDYATAEAKAQAKLPSGCFLSPGRCQQG